MNNQLINALMETALSQISLVNNLHRDIAAYKVIESNFDAMLSFASDALDGAAARALVHEDLNAFITIEDANYRYFAAVAIGDNAKYQAAYQAELQHQNPAAEKETAAAYAENESRITDKESRKAASFYRMAADVRAKGAKNWTPEEAALQAQLDCSIYTISTDETERGFIFDEMKLNGSVNQDYKKALEDAAPNVAQDVQCVPAEAL